MQCILCVVVVIRTQSPPPTFVHHSTPRATRPTGYSCTYVAPHLSASSFCSTLPSSASTSSSSSSSTSTHIHIHIRIYIRLATSA